MARVHVFAIGLILSALVSNCAGGSSGCSSGLVLVDRILINVEEPSGLSLHHEGQLICVSDHRSEAYILSPRGEKLGTISIDNQDAEGVYYSQLEASIFHVNESSGELIKSDYKGQTLEQWPILEDKGNKGLEGCAVDEQRGLAYLLREKNPGQLLILDLATGSVRRQGLSFSKDYSGLCYDAETDRLYIISDDSQCLSVCSVTGQELGRYPLCIDKPEGIAIDRAAQRLYIVSDSEAALYVYELP